MASRRRERDRVHGTVTAIDRLAATALVAVLATTCAVAAVVMEPAAARTLGPPRISATPSTVRPGDSVRVGANDLAPLTDYQVEVCGNGGFGTSAECNQASTITAATSELGQFSVVLRLQSPPVPCPCVVKALLLQSTAAGPSEQEVSTPITILGMPTATPRPPSNIGNPSGLVVDRADLVGARSWAEWFGGAPHRTLVLELRDAGANLIPSTPFVLRSGPKGHPTQIESAPVVPPLHPGQVVSYRVPVTFPILAHGDYVVVGTLGSAGQTVKFRVTTPLMPWGIVFTLGFVVLVALGLLIWRIVRPRRGQTDGEAVDGIPTPGPAAAKTDLPAGDGDPNGVRGDETTGTPPVSTMFPSDAETAGAS